MPCACVTPSDVLLLAGSAKFQRISNESLRQRFRKLLNIAKQYLHLDVENQNRSIIDGGCSLNLPDSMFQEHNVNIVNHSYHKELEVGKIILMQASRERGPA